ncbi:hypothetical protein [Psychromicrobium lacuslunae]|uniref:Uncharacterized protein n=1 Tax=Psychromicrobium lacuslunae TaxID=1618207 RepID=A0A0D4BZJ4_9MICC|nr:hypothetical protein [Psychromicrobium lacuslunae]AJT41555.1 hypothetical protein UM93_08590 [Psychromicrobium lacuslunae]
MPEFSEAEQRELAARILRRTEALQTNCSEALTLPYRASPRVRPLPVIFAIAAAAGLLLTGVYFIGLPADHAARSASWHGESAINHAADEQGANSIDSIDPVSCFFRGVHRVLG